MDDKQLEEIESFATQLCYDSGQILLDYFQKPINVDYKSKDQTNPVTEADKRSEEYLRESIIKAFPGHGILAEEGSKVTTEDSDCIWVIDPLDGTTNFVNGFPMFGASIGVLDKGVPVVGCVFLPSPKDSKGDIFHARAGGGAFRNSEPINVSTDKKPRKSRVSVFPAAYQQSFRFKDEFRKSFGDLRSPGSTVYEIAMTACGPKDSRDTKAFCRDSLKFLPIAIASPTDFIEVPSIAGVVENFSKVNLGTLVTT